ncbi:MAG TPA: Hsp20/alpha crystallin family protein [Gemmatimonadaceae bacterium]
MFSTLDRMLTLNRVLDEALTGSPSGEFWVPALDVVEQQDAYLIALEVPGVDPSTVDISFEHNVLTVRGEKKFDLDSKKSGDARVHANERVSGKFQRAIRLPEFVDAENISAETVHGVLHLTVPKAQAARARKIQIKGVEPKQIVN